MEALTAADEADVASIHDYELTLEFNYKPAPQIFFIPLVEKRFKCCIYMATPAMHQHSLSRELHCMPGP